MTSRDASSPILIPATTRGYRSATFLVETFSVATMSDPSTKVSQVIAATYRIPLTKLHHCV